jgi:VWFA-related protein
MWGPLLVCALLATPAQEDSRTIRVTLTAEDGRPISGLDPSEVAVVENGAARVVLEVAPEDRPLTLALIVDNSEATRSALKLSVAPALSGFLQALPAGTTIAIWTTGDRPTKALDYTDDRAAAERAIARLNPIGGNTFLDALVEASRDLGKKKEGERTAVVAVTGFGPELSYRDRYQVVDDAAKNADTFLSVAYDESRVNFDDRQSYEYVLSGLADRTGGRYDTVLTPMAVEGALQKLLGDLKSQYRLTYVPGPDIKEKDRKLEVKVARPGTKIRFKKGRS